MNHQPKQLSLAIAAILFPACAGWANPTGPQVVQGQATIQSQGPTLNINNSNGAVINWQQFSIGKGETTRFNQPSASSSVLNRVQGPDPSTLQGTLSSNGKVYLINPAGVLVGPGAKIDVAGFVASTLNLSNANFQAGKHQFDATPSAGKVENQGDITTPTGGKVYLVGAEVRNEGLIHTPQGKVVLAAGDKVKLEDSSAPGVTVEITGSKNQATNLGRIVAESGEVGVVGAMVRNSGVINANQVVRDQSGRVFLKATHDVSVGTGSQISADANPSLKEGGKAGSVSIESAKGDVTVAQGATVSANGPSGGAIAVTAPQGQANLAGTLEAKGSAAKGGAITAEAKTVQVAATARLDVSGKIEGGRITLTATGGPAKVEPGAKLIASGAKGGKITVTAKRDKVEQAGSLNVRGTVGGGGQAQLQAATVVSHTGEVQADGQTQGGKIDLVAERVEQNGFLSADGQTDGGKVALNATVAVRQFEGGAISARGVSGQGGTVTVASRTSPRRSPSDPTAPPPDPTQSLISGNVRVTGRRGGKFQLTGDQTGLLDGASVDASGEEGGGEVLIGGDYQGKNPDVPNAEASYVAPSAFIRADAGYHGGGERIIVWADKATRVYGHISAKGGAQGGDGGFVETSGAYLDAPVVPDVTAAAGQGGTWLLDPNNITIQATGGTNTNISGDPDFTTTNDGAVIDTGTIQTALNSGISVSVTTGIAGANLDVGNINVSGTITKSAGVDATLTLVAHNNININTGASITSTAGKLNLTLTPNSDATGGGTSLLNSTINLNGGTLSFANGLTLNGGATRISNSTVISGDGAALTLSGNADLDAVTLGDSAHPALAVTGTVDIYNGLTLADGA
ncbi:two-partner secretion domain-containing protein, partial [Methylomagnum sp.]